MKPLRHKSNPTISAWSSFRFIIIKRKSTTWIFLNRTTSFIKKKFLLNNENIKGQINKMKSFFWYTNNCIIDCNVIHISKRLDCKMCSAILIYVFVANILQAISHSLFIQLSKIVFTFYDKIGKLEVYFEYFVILKFSLLCEPVTC